MSKRSKLPGLGRLALIASLVFLCSAILLVSRAGINKPKTHEHINTAIVRLHDVETGRFFCSGTVISDTVILTAAHCVVRQEFFGVEVVRKVEIRSLDGKPLGIYATLSGANPRQDVALLSGTFDLFDHMNVEIAPEKIEASFMHSKHLKACGYPAGGKLVCTVVSDVHHLNFGFSADGFLYPGMSGGPVIDEDTGNIIAVNTAVIESHIYLSPTEELFNQVN